MNSMTSTLFRLPILLAVLATAGCVERRFVVTTDPPGALVLRNGKPIGASPADDHFTYYGNYHFTLVKEGYATTQVDQKIRAPWYQWFPLEPISEILWPFQIEDVRKFHFKMEPLQPTRPDELLQEAERLREKGHNLPPPTQQP